MSELLDLRVGMNLLNLGLFCVMAIETSLGKRSWRTKAMMVEMSRAVTVKGEMAKNPPERWENEAGKAMSHPLEEPTPPRPAE